MILTDQSVVAKLDGQLGPVVIVTALPIVKTGQLNLA